MLCDVPAKVFKWFWDIVLPKFMLVCMDVGVGAWVSTSLCTNDMSKSGVFTFVCVRAWVSTGFAIGYQARLFCFSSFLPFLIFIVLPSVIIVGWCCWYLLVVSSGV